jgi:DNA-binding NarL/FixJ family response regulator
MKVRILIADDHEVVRRGLAMVLTGSPIEVVAEAATPEEAIILNEKHHPDVVVMDYRIGDDGGVDAVTAIRQATPNRPVIMFSAFDNPIYVLRAAGAGVHDYIPKTASPQQLVDGILRAHRGQPAPDDSLMRRIQAGMARRKDRKQDPDNPLTNRELQVLRHVSLGLSNKEIGNALEISVETVKEHVQNILRKLRAPDRTAAAVWAVKSGLI